MFQLNKDSGWILYLGTQLLCLLQCRFQVVVVWMRLWSILQDLKSTQQNEKSVNSQSHVCSLGSELEAFLCPAYVLDDERVAGDPLHGLEQEAGQGHALTPGIHG